MYSYPFNPLTVTSPTRPSAATQDFGLRNFQPGQGNANDVQAMVRMFMAQGYPENQARILAAQSMQNMNAPAVPTQAQQEDAYRQQLAAEFQQMRERDEAQADAKAKADAEAQAASIRNSAAFATALEAFTKQAKEARPENNTPRAQIIAATPGRPYQRQSRVAPQIEGLLARARQRRGLIG